MIHWFDVSPTPKFINDIKRLPAMLDAGQAFQRWLESGVGGSAPNSKTIATAAELARKFAVNSQASL
jgi:hypothetical protein